MFLPIQHINFPLETFALSPDDRAAFRELKSFFQKNKVSSSTCFRHHSSFRDELDRILKFVNRSTEHRQARALMSGVIQGNSFICVNSRQLQILMGRSKSSVNNCLQQLGYSSMKPESKSKSFLLSTLPILLKDASLFRQWTVRSLNQENKLLPTPLIDRPLMSGNLFEKFEIENDFESLKPISLITDHDIEIPDLSRASLDFSWLNI